MDRITLTPRPPRATTFAEWAVRNLASFADATGRQITRATSDRESDTLLDQQFALLRAREAVLASLRRTNARRA